MDICDFTQAIALHLVYIYVCILLMNHVFAHMFKEMFLFHSQYTFLVVYIHEMHLSENTYILIGEYVFSRIIMFLNCVCMSGFEGVIFHS